MTTDNTSAPETQGGADWESGAAADATTQAAEAWRLNPTPETAEAWNKAIRDMNAAVGSQSMKSLSAIAAPIMAGVQRLEAGQTRLETGVEKSIRRLEDTWETRFDYMLGVIDRHLKTMDARLDVYGDQITAQGNKIDVLTTDLELFKVESRTDRDDIRNMISSLPEAEQLKVIREVQTDVAELRRLWRQTRVILLFTLGSVGLSAFIFVMYLVSRG